MAKQSLNDYRKNRDFKHSAEPKGEKGSHKPLFVIQKHDATQLHYDFRLAIDGALASWAVPKGLSTAANEKRLAVKTEEHPMDYADFEGTIPQEQYGGGTVMVWDIGEYEPIIDDESHEKTMAEAVKQGALKFKLKGEKIKGGYSLVRMNNDGDKKQWFIFKLDDDEADARRNPVSTEPDSVLTGRSLDEIASEDKK